MLNVVSTLRNDEVVSTPKTVDKALTLLQLETDRRGSHGVSSAARPRSPCRPPTGSCARSITTSAYGTTKRTGTVSGDTAWRSRSRFLEGIDLCAQALPRLVWLAEVTGETAHLGVPDGTEVVYLDQGRDPASGANAQLHRCPVADAFHCDGKALLALDDTELVQQVIDSGLDRIRRVAAAIHADERRPVGAISVSGPASRITDERVTGAVAGTLGLRPGGKS